MRVSGLTSYQQVTSWNELHGLFSDVTTLKTIVTILWPISGKMTPPADATKFCEIHEEMMTEDMMTRAAANENAANFEQLPDSDSLMG